MSKSEVKPFKVRQSILYSGGNKPEGSPDFYTMEVIEYSAYQSLQKENEELKAIIGKLKQAINSLETLQYITPNMREAAYNKAVLDCQNRLNQALQSLREFLGEESGGEDE